jgi:putative membrane protein
MVAQILIGFIALLHFYILWMEMFAWETRGKKVFKNALAPELFAATKGLAANQGLYNVFLAAGLIWSLCISDPIWKVNVATFFLACVATAGLYGGLTTDKKIIYVQTVPSTLALICLYFC